MSSEEEAVLGHWGHFGGGKPIVFLGPSPMVILFKASATALLKLISFTYHPLKYAPLTHKNSNAKEKGGKGC